jgi:hypothetical protein
VKGVFDFDARFCSIFIRCGLRKDNLVISQKMDFLHVGQPPASKQIWPNRPRMPKMWSCHFVTRTQLQPLIKLHVPQSSRLSRSWKITTDAEAAKVLHSGSRHGNPPTSSYLTLLGIFTCYDDRENVGKISTSSNSKQHLPSLNSFLGVNQRKASIHHRPRDREEFLSWGCKM